MAEIICDFCSRQPVTARYEAHSFTHCDENGVRITSRGDWAACAGCAALIDSQDFDALLTRSVQTFADIYGPVFVAMIGPDALRAEIGLIHQQFRAARVVKV